MTTMWVRSCLTDALPFLAMVMVECCEVGMTTLSKAGMNGGMSNLVFVVYYNSLGTFVLLPFFIFQRNRSGRLPLSFHLIGKFFILGLLGISLLQVNMYTGVKLSSPTLSAAMGNLIPAFTFLLAVICRMERFNIRKASSKAKGMGTVLAIAGALIMTLYEGPTILNAILQTPTPAATHSHHHQPTYQPPTEAQWILGALLLAINSVLVSTWSILQAATVKEFPEGITIIFFSECFGSILCAIFSLIIERNPDAWILPPGTELIAVIFSALFGVALRSNILTWCLHKKGPLYVAMFQPLAVVIAAITGLLFLGDALHLGSIIGSLIIAIGFYAVTWGQDKEKDLAESSEENLSARSESSSIRTPLLPN